VTALILEPREREQFVGFCFVNVSILRLLPSLPLSLISCHHDLMSRRLWLPLQLDFDFGYGLSSDHVPEIPPHELRSCHLFRIVKGVTLYVQCEGNKIHPLKICVTKRTLATTAWGTRAWACCRRRKIDIDDIRRRLGAPGGECGECRLDGSMTVAGGGASVLC
jgi:hypothetical protein